MKKTMTALLPETLRHGHFFSLPNEIFELGLKPGELAVYCYLRRCADRETYQCWPSYKTIGAAVGMSFNTVRKNVCALVDKGLVATEDTSVIDKCGKKWNGNLKYTILPVSDALDAHRKREFDRLAAETAKWRYAKSA